ncbi:hypothetical protein CHS0354_021654 [Potamilus streckersoni]|uniref:D-aminoacyl-tRNA deacylase n=1 Tax=Potamilus streckersoni TaxID=2493646 RepID=A0AAE0VZ56_9BIVA|nr:hypothetical protein CHS0354_021654 [Potamilus streckersoni]
MDADGPDSSPKVRIVLQQCLSARLMVQPATEVSEAQYVEIGRGLILHVCFMKGATPDIMEKIVKSCLNVKLSSSAENEKLVSVLDLPGDVLIVPQASLGGNLKGKVMQYHRNIDKDEGIHLYNQFVTLCKDTVQSCNKCREKGCVVMAGTYGNRQVLKMDTDGPYTHLIEF